MSKGDNAESETAVATVMDVLRPYALETSKLFAKYPYLETVRMKLGDNPVFFRYTALFEPVSAAQFMLMALVFNDAVSSDHVTMAMYSASVAAQCSYCVMHTCALFKRGEVQLDRITNDDAPTADRAIRGLGASLGTIPTSVTPSVITSLREHFSDSEIQNLAITASAMGYLTSGNDLLSCDIESILVKNSKDYLDATGWTTTNPYTKDDDSQSSAAPGWFDGIRKLIIGLQWHMFRTYAVWAIPTTTPQIHDYITGQLGASFSIFDDLPTDVARVNLAYTLCEYLTSPKCTYPRALKYAVGMAYATRGNNEKLRDEMSTLYRIEHEKSADSKYPPDLGQRLCGALANADMWVKNEEWVSSVASTLRTDGSFSNREVLALLVSLCMCSAPSKTCPELARLVQAGMADITPSGLMEIISWTSTLVVLDRVMSFYSVYSSVKN